MIGHMMILQYQFTQSINGFLIQLIWDDIHEIRLGVNYHHDWIQHTIDKNWSFM